MSDPQAVAEATNTAARMDACVDYALHHLANSTSWHIPGLLHAEFELPTFTLHALMLLVGAGVMLVVFGALYRKDTMVPSGMTNLLEVFVLFIRDEIAVTFLGKEDGRRMTPLLCSFFFFILLLNLMGLVPFFASTTGNISVTMGLATVTLCVMIFGTIRKSGVGGFVGAFMPPGVPWPILVLLIPIEFLGLFIKAAALSIRLFANMMAGHIVIGALISLAVAYGLLGAPALLLAFAIYFLKIFVCILQAYIFTLLSAMFIGMMYHPAH